MVGITIPFDVGIWFVFGNHFLKVSVNISLHLHEFENPWILSLAIHAFNYRALQ
jgi:hypothetical protein